MNTTKTLIAGAAVAGLMAGSLPVRAYAANAPTQAGVSLQTMAEARRVKRMPAKDRTPVKARVAANPVTTVAKGKTPAKAKAAAPPRAS